MGSSKIKSNPKFNPDFIRKQRLTNNLIRSKQARSMEFEKRRPSFKSDREKFISERNATAPPKKKVIFDKEAEAPSKVKKLVKKKSVPLEKKAKAPPKPRDSKNKATVSDETEVTPKVVLSTEREVEELDAEAPIFKPFLPDDEAAEVAKSLHFISKDPEAQRIIGPFTGKINIAGEYIDKKRKVRMKNVQCIVCRIRGHFAKDCPLFTD